MRSNITLKSLHLCLIISKYIWNDPIRSYKLNITKTSLCSLFSLRPLSSKTGLWICSENMTCPHRGRTLVMLIVLPETQVAFFSSFFVVWQGFVAGETGNEEFWPCLSTLILQLTGRQRGLQQSTQMWGHGFRAQVLCLAAGHFPV